MNRAKINKLFKYAEQFRKQAQVAYKRNPQTGEMEEISAQEGKKLWDAAEREVAQQSAPAKTSNYGNAYEQGLVKLMQRFLQSQKLNPGPDDGKLGPQTMAALKRWQKSVGLPETGSMDRATFEKMSGSIPEFKTMLEQEGTARAPINLDYIKQIIANARQLAQELNNAYKAGQLTDKNINQFKAKIDQFVNPSSQTNVAALAQQMSAMAAQPKLDPTQKKEITDLLFNVNDAATALAQWNQILSAAA